jgi:hypothetical protein
LATTTKALKEGACLQLYLGAIEALDEFHFDKASRAFFSHSFQKKDEPMSAHSLYRYYMDSRCKIQNHVLGFFPKDLLSMKSGCGFQETCNKVYVTAYRLEMRKHHTQEEVEQMLPPPMWEYTKSPWYFGLVVKIFRRDPQLALNVAEALKDKTNKPTSRAELRRQKQILMKGGAAAAAPPVAKNTGAAPPVVVKLETPESSASSLRYAEGAGASAATTLAANQDKLVKARLLTSKAHAESANIAKRMGKIEELEKGMALLERMRSVIGQELFAQRVKSLFDALPNFENFETAVKIIDVDADDEPRINWGTTKRELATEVDGVTTSHHRNDKKGKVSGEVSHDAEQELDDNQDSNVQDREIVWYNELGRFRPDGYVMG